MQFVSSLLSLNTIIKNASSPKHKNKFYAYLYLSMIKIKTRLFSDNQSSRCIIDKDVKLNNSSAE